MASVKIERTAFPDSIVIAEIRCFPNHSDLEVTFRSGSVYLYHAVPPAIAEAFSQAESAGSYFHDAVLDRYRFTRLR